MQRDRLPRPLKNYEPRRLRNQGQSLMIEARSGLNSWLLDNDYGEVYVRFTYEFSKET
jgi:hypothetical protein